MVAFEAAVGGGIPIIKALREGLVANHIEWIAGIINGTTNFILSEMRSKGVDFASALADAQANGYAEADPTFDIEGIDAAHKLSLMSAMAFGIPVRFDQAYVEGITKIEPTDIRYAEELGYRVKLLGITRRCPDGSGAARPPDVDPVVTVDRERRGRHERGAGQGRRGGANALLRRGCRRTTDGVGGHRRPRRHRAPDHRRPRTPRAAPGVPAGPRERHPVLPIDEVTSGYYLRLQVADEPGVLADVTRILADEHISIEAALQREPGEEGQASVVLLTHECIERDVRAAIAKIEALPASVGPVVSLRMEKLALVHRPKASMASGGCKARLDLELSAEHQPLGLCPRLRPYRTDMGADCVLVSRLFTRRISTGLLVTVHWYRPAADDRPRTGASALCGDHSGGAPRDRRV